ncbi:MAG: hypothetical protein K1X72_02295 [Pyrinomonadaceae bacterium]|nr:hypothetical protein [Pyrinomonadaceae bacterium]
MKFRQLIFILTVILSSSLFIFGQKKEDFLVKGNPSLTVPLANQIIEVFEFGLKGAFNKDQRKIFTQELISQWKSDVNAGTNYVKLLEIYQQIQNLPEQQKQFAQSQFLKMLLDEIDKNPNLPRYKILIEVFYDARGAEFERSIAN